MACPARGWEKWGSETADVQADLQVLGPAKKKKKKKKKMNALLMLPKSVRVRPKQW